MTTLRKGKYKRRRRSGKAPSDLARSTNAALHPGDMVYSRNRPKLRGFYAGDKKLPSFMVSSINPRTKHPPVHLRELGRKDCRYP